MRVVIAVALALGALRLGAQDVKVTVPAPFAPGQTAGPAGQREYGQPRFAELASMDAAPQAYQDAHVLTFGMLDPLTGENFTLKDGGPPVLVMASHEVTAADLMTLAGQRAEVRGIFRRIRPKQYVRGVDVDLLEHPTLPVLPAPDFALPRNSITVLAITPKDGGRSREGPGALAVMVREIRENPAQHLHKKVRIVGQFRGSNLFSDLPASSRRERADWVLKDGDAALWVTGKEPRGKGWALDPRYQGDTARFVAVEGKPEIVNGIVYLRASKVSLAAPPAPKTDDDESP